MSYTNKHLKTSAIFWAEKAVLLSSGELDDIVRYCSCLIADGQYRRAATHLKCSPHLESCPGLRYLLAVCLAESKSWDEVVTLLKGVCGQNSDTTCEEENKVVSQILGDTKSAAQMLLGKAYENIGNVTDAVNCYQQALMIDVYCEEALERLHVLETLSEYEEKGLMSALHYKKQCSIEEEHMLRYLYELKLNHSKLKPNQPLKNFLYPLTDSIDFQCSKAKHFLSSLKVDQCYALTSSLLQKESLHAQTILLHIACCVTKGNSKELYSLGHELVQTSPQSSLTWYTVSCYYLTTGRHGEARRYLTKALSITPLFSPAHIAFGTSFTLEGEHDQAIAAFSNAARCMQGSYFPLLCLGKEYFISGSFVIASSFLKNALSLAPNEPMLLQEIGVVLASSGSYAKAEKYLTQARTVLRSNDPHGTLPIWETVCNNLGHVLRKQGKLVEALDAHMQALQVDPHQPTTLTAIAFVYLLQEEYKKAMDFCQHSLLVRREDQFTVEVMQKAVEELVSRPVTLSPAVSLDNVLSQKPSPPSTTLPMQTE